jgi:hypothetical protein
MKDAIPKNWRKILKGSAAVCICNELKVKLHHCEKNVSLITNKEVYWKFIFSITEKATAISNWEQIYPEVEFDWPHIFSIPYIAVRETNLRSLQYQILHRFFPCNYTLNKWYPEHDNVCNYCTELDTVEHYFYECTAVQYFWSSFYKWWYNVASINLNLNFLDIIFGVQNPFEYNIIDALNFCILFAKRFLYQQKKNDKKKCSFYAYQIDLKNRLEIEHLLSIEHGSEEHFNELWLSIYDQL